jgi:hypothetical protein
MQAFFAVFSFAGFILPLTDKYFGVTLVKFAA